METVPTQTKIHEDMIRQRKFFDSGKTLWISFRKRQLQKLYQTVQKYEEEILDALYADLNKPRFEAYETEIGMLLSEISFTLRHMEKWARPRGVKTSIANFPAKSCVYPEPYGVTLIMSPWNYPFLLTLEPLVGAIAAGNCAILKPSAYSPAVSKILKKIIEEIYPPYYVTVIEGGRKENQSLLKEPFDMIFFTGSAPVGKMVMEAASQNLTPVCLELGGKSPCIVDETANLNLAAKRIVWGKFLNAGQTCVAPDYLLVQENVKMPLLKKMVSYIKKLYGEFPAAFENFPKIVNEKHFNRLESLLNSGNVVTGGEIQKGTLKISPTILEDVSFDSPIMQEEIFGPILPVLTYQTFEEAIEKIKKHPKPLAAYLFTQNKRNENYFLSRLSFGGGCINDTIMHLASSTMPFGGVGNSGMGSYHGKNSFLLFSHEKSIVKKSTLLDVPLRYPPYKKVQYQLIKTVLK